jgi:energy-coupling factor transporter ATP-binding protein EcfA2
MKKNKTPRPNPSAVGTDTPAVTPAVIMNQTDSPKIRLENITYYYGKGTPFEVKALDSVSLDIHGGKLTGIIGHTGSGKSTLVQLLNGLSRAGEGRVLLDGEDIWARPKEIGKIRYRVGLVMQYPEYQLFEETVFADIAYGPRNMKLSEEEVKERVYKAATFAGVSPDLMEKSPFDLSGGQKRRVAIAGIMAMEPEVLVLDEPAAGLDPRVATPYSKAFANTIAIRAVPSSSSATAWRTWPSTATTWWSWPMPRCSWQGIATTSLPAPTSWRRWDWISPRSPSSACSSARAVCPCPRDSTPWTPPRMLS